MPPIGYPGNSISKAARAKSGGGFESAIENAAPQSFVAESGFSLTDNGDGTMTITDSESRFGTKPNGQKPVRVFEWGSNGSITGSEKGRYTGLTSSANVSIVSTESNTSESTSLEIDYADAAISVLSQIDQDANDEFYSFFSRKHNFTGQDQVNGIGSSWNLKYMGFTEAEATNQGAFISSTYGAGSNADGNPKTQYNKAASDTTGTIFAGADVGLTDYLWHNEEMYVKLSSAAGADDAVHRWYLDGLKAEERTGFISHAAEINRFKYFKLMRNESMIASSRTYVGFMVIDDSLCMPFVSDQANWDESVSSGREPQIVSSWASGEITFFHRLGAFSDTTGKALYMRLSDNSTVKVGEWP